MGGPLCGIWKDEEVKNLLGILISKRLANPNPKWLANPNVFPGVLTEATDKHNDELNELKRQYVAYREMCNTSIETIDKILNERLAHGGEGSQIPQELEEDNGGRNADVFTSSNHIVVQEDGDGSDGSVHQVQVNQAVVVNRLLLRKR